MTIHTEIMGSIIMLQLQQEQRRIGGSWDRGGLISIWYFIRELVISTISIALIHYKQYALGVF